MSGGAGKLCSGFGDQEMKKRKGKGRGVGVGREKKGMWLYKGLERGYGNKMMKSRMSDGDEADGDEGKRVRGIMDERGEQRGKVASA
jgi:hypothetical protein